MIEITDYNGRKTYLAAAAISSITETGVSSQWHGIRAVVRTFDGQIIEAQETANEIQTRVKADVEAQP